MATSWEDVREEWSKAEQMGLQSVLQAAAVGQMLLNLKADKEQTPHGTFTLRCAEIQKSDASDFSKEELHAARDWAFRLMRLARHVPLLEEHKPDSIRAALACIKEHNPKMMKPKLVGWTKAVEQILGTLPAGFSRNTLAQDRKKKEAVAAECGFPIPSRVDPTSAETNKIAEAVQRLAFRLQSDDQVRVISAEAEAAHDALSVTAKDKLAAARKKMEREVQARFELEVERRCEPLREKLQREYVAQAEETERLRQIRAGIRGMLTREEFNLIRSCLHPDKQSEDRRDRYNRAFEVFNRLESAVNDKPTTRQASAGSSFADIKKAATARGIH